MLLGGGLSGLGLGLSGEVAPAVRGASHLVRLGGGGLVAGERGLAAVWAARGVVRIHAVGPAVVVASHGGGSGGSEGRAGGRCIGRNSAVSTVVGAVHLEVEVLVLLELDD